MTDEETKHIKSFDKIRNISCEKIEKVLNFLLEYDIM